MKMGRYRAWVELPFVSDHASVVVQFAYQPFLVAYPFKLNPTWLIEEDFEHIVKDVWNDPILLAEADVQYRFVLKLKTLKARIKSWAKLKRAEQQRRLVSLEGEIRDVTAALPRLGSSDNRQKTLELE